MKSTESHRTVTYPSPYGAGLNIDHRPWGMAEVCNGATDFVLFPPDQLYLESFDSQSGDEFNNLLLHHSRGMANAMHRHRDFSGHVGTSYEAYPPVSAYSPSLFEGPNPLLDASKTVTGQPVQRHMSSGSLSPLTSQSFDHRSSTLSSASGASAHSTASSTDGSPYTNATHGLPYPEKWSEPLHGLGIGPEIVNSEAFNHDQFPSSNIENDFMLEGNKFPSYVGEYPNIFSPSSSQSLPVIPFVSSTSSSSNVVSALFSPRLSLDVMTSTRNNTIDSILEEANSIVRNPSHLISPVSAVSSSASPTSHMGKCKNVVPSEGRSSFKSPRTPASAASHFPSPLGSPLGLGGSPRQKTTKSDSAKAESSPQHSHRFHPYSRQTQVPPSHGHSLFEKTPDPFFGQCSGRFIAPLESSCWFSLPSPFCTQM